MTEQETFDTVVTALREQGCQSVLCWESSLPLPSKQNLCRYRGENDTKCAAGHLIPDELYDENMESHDWMGLVQKWPSIAALGLPNDLVFALQQIHDHQPVEDWEMYWRELAETHNLKYVPPRPHRHLGRP